MKALSLVILFTGRRSRFAAQYPLDIQELQGLPRWQGVKEKQIFKIAATSQISIRGISDQSTRKVLSDAP
jgi:hypothetical protein